MTRKRAVVLPRPGSADVATVTRGDVALRRIPRPMWPLVRIGMGLRRKRILGHEFAGEWQVSVELVGLSGGPGTTA